MPARKPWTLAALERGCRKVFIERTRLKLKAMPIAAAEASWTGDGVVQTAVDPFSVSHLSGVLHELMHIVLERELEPFAEYGPGMKRELAEIAIEAWEAALANEILSSPRRKAWWRRAIRGKLPKRA